LINLFIIIRFMGGISLVVGVIGGMGVRLLGRLMGVGVMVEGVAGNGTGVEVEVQALVQDGRFLESGFIFVFMAMD
jgi:hypothetical protein